MVDHNAAHWQAHPPAPTMDADMERERLARALSRQPKGNDTRSQLFWLVDLIYVCKNASEAAVRAQAGLLEEALGAMGTFLETGDAASLAQTEANPSASPPLFARAASRRNPPIRRLFL